MLLAGFIYSDHSEGSREPDTDLESEPEATVANVTLSEPAAKWGLGLNESSFSSRPTIVPVGSKALAVSALRNMATSSEANLQHITSQEGVIPQLVSLMTRMNDSSDDNSSASSRDKKSPEVRDERRSQTNAALEAKMDIELHNRKQLANENRQLAEAAGEMLHGLIVTGNVDAHSRSNHARANDAHTAP